MRKLRLWAIRWLVRRHVASANGILVEALPWFATLVQFQCHKLSCVISSTLLTIPDTQFPHLQNGRASVSVCTWFLHSINEMSVKCRAQKRGSTNDSEYSEDFRQELGPEEGRDPLAAWEVRWDHHQVPTKAKSQVQLGPSHSPVLPR